DFPEMCGIVKMPTRAIGHMLDLLIQWGTAGEDGDVLRRARRRQARPPAQ
ncbi:hypothetical protein HN588_17315, partial [Candidatus Bathyarchaeota archaeon]|nr:hypothetical protein [Candidatus Bathyarchaeota archaeon]